MPLSRNSSHAYSFVSQLFFCFLPFALLFSLTCWLTHGNFTYTLDDPYIHLALAKNIAHGFYGINYGEASAPSSRILWPFLLAPFSLTPELFEFSPLAINLVCLCAFIHVIGKITEGMNFCFRLFVVGIISFSLNIYGIVFTGMEHSLHILLVALVLLPFLTANQTDANKPGLPVYAIVSLVLLPLVRYEGLAISLPVIAYIFAKGERMRAMAVFAAIAFLVGGFSVYLYSKGLGILPSSVVAKSTHHGISGVIENLN